MKFTFDKYLPTKIISYLLLICMAIAFYFIVLRWDNFVVLVQTFFGPFRAFVYGFVVAYLLKGFVNYSERTFLKKIKRKKLQRVVSIFLAMILLFAILGAIITAVLPQLTDSVLNLANNISSYVLTLETFTNDLITTYEIDELYTSQILEWTKDLEATITEVVKGFLPLFLNFMASSASKIGNFLIGLFVAVYLLYSKETLCAQLKKLLIANFKEDTNKRITDIAALTDKTFYGFISGKIIDSAIIGVLCFITMTILKLDYVLLISVIVGITNIIPFFGPFIGAIPSIIILFMVDPMQAVVFAIMILALQQLDGNVIGPKILGDSMGLPLIWIMFAIIVGGGLFGFLGMIIGVPAFAVAYKLISINTKNKLAEKNLPTETKEYV